MNFDSMPPPIPLPPPIAADTTPSVADVATTVETVEKVKRQRLLSPASVTDKNLCDAVVFEKQVYNVCSFFQIVVESFNCADH